MKQLLVLLTILIFSTTLCATEYSDYDDDYTPPELDMDALRAEMRLAVAVREARSDAETWAWFNTFNTFIGVPAIFVLTVLNTLFILLMMAKNAETKYKEE